MVRCGGWRRDRFIRENRAAVGRVWERHPPEARRLEFGPIPLAFLIWLTAENPNTTSDPWDAPAGDLSPADEFFFAVAYDRLRQLPDLKPAISSLPIFHRNGLCWLTYPADFPRGEDFAPPPFDTWADGSRSIFLECLQPLLAALWLRSEREKGRITSWPRMHRQGRAEHETLTAYLAALEKAGRVDLSRFVLTAAAGTLRLPGIGPEYWLGGLKEHRPARLEDRLETQRFALAIPRQLEKLQAWERQARTVGYWDEYYEASQVWKADWEAANGDELAAQARQLLGQVEPLRPD